MDFHYILSINDRKYIKFPLIYRNVNKLGINKTFQGIILSILSKNDSTTI